MAPPIILKDFECPICGKQNRLWEGTILRLQDAERLAKEITFVDVEVDLRQDCDSCYPHWMADMKLAESDELEQWQKDLGMKVYRMERDEHDFREDKRNHLRLVGFYMTLILSHASLPEPARVFLESNDVRLFFMLLDGSKDRSLVSKQEAGVELSKLEQWCWSVRQRFSSHR